MSIFLINSIVLCGFAFFVLFSRHTIPENKNYAAGAFLAAVLHIACFLTGLTASPRLASFVIQVGFAAIIFLPPVFYHFTLTIIDASHEKRRYLPVVYGISLLFFVLNFTTYFIKGVAKEEGIFRIIPGSLFHGLSVYVFIIGIVLTAVITRALKTTSHSQEFRLKSFRISMIFGGVVFFAGLSWFLGFPSGKAAAYAVIPLFFWFAYITVYNTSLGLGGFLRRGLIVVALGLLFSGIFMFCALIMESVLQQSPDHRLLYPAFITGLVMAVLYPSFKEWATMIITRLFFRRRFEGEKVSKDLSKQILSILKKEEIYHYIMSTAGFLLNCNKLAIFSPADEGRKFIFRAAEGIDRESMNDVILPQNSFFIKHLLQSKSIISWKSITADYRKIKIREELEPLALLGLSYFVPFISRDAILIILMVGRSERDTVFTDEDRELLSGLVANGTMAIENIQLLEINEKLKELDEMKRDFISNVTHELKSPLTAIQSCVEFLLKKKGGNLTRIQMDYLVMVQNNAVRLTRFISQLLDISRIEAARLDLFKEEISIPNLAQEIALLFGPYADEKGIKIRVFAQPDIMEVSADQDKIKQVLTNLVSNALKFTDQGEITVTVTGRPDCIETAVSDTGVGIPKEAIGKLFDKFYQVKETHKIKKFGGTGLGLAIVKGIIDAHGGRIWVESVAGKGTIFTFTLPKESWET